MTTGSLRERYERAFLKDWQLRHIGGAPRLLRRLSDEFTRLLAEDDPEAMEMHAEGVAEREEQARALIGPDPLADRAEDWPTALGKRRGPVVNVPATAPVYGWRTWWVEDDRLLAPVMLAGALNGVDELQRDDPGVMWQPGANQVQSAHCTRQLGVPAVKRPGPHPNRRCRCGIRIVQSLTVLEAFDRSVIDGAFPTAWARVAVWGRVAPWVPDDDWPFTARAEYAEIVVGHLLLPEDAEHLRPGLVARYGEALA